MLYWIAMWVTELVVKLREPWGGNPPQFEQPGGGLYLPIIITIVAAIIGGIIGVIALRWARKKEKEEEDKFIDKLWKRRPKS